MCAHPAVPLPVLYRREGHVHSLPSTHTAYTLLGGLYAALSSTKAARPCPLLCTSSPTLAWKPGGPRLRKTRAVACRYDTHVRHTRAQTSTEARACARNSFSPPPLPPNTYTTHAASASHEFSPPQNKHIAPPTTPPSVHHSSTQKQMTEPSRSSGCVRRSATRSLLDKPPSPSSLRRLAQSLLDDSLCGSSWACRAVQAARHCSSRPIPWLMRGRVAPCGPSLSASSTSLSASST
jgi:hypothetical protein